uniref:Uncharacterized protein n=1 Tax=Clytia hemisphaerica TaxID=252671 RepID=A0A7M5U8P2_9CNID
MNLKEVQLKLGKFKDDIQKKIFERGITSFQLLIIQQLICNLILVVATPVHNIQINLQRIKECLQNSQISANDFILVTNLLEEKANYSSVIEFRNVVIFLGFALTLFSFLNSKKSSSTLTNKTAAMITSLVFVWMLFSFNLFLPLRESLVSDFHGLATLINHPINSIGMVIVTLLSLPFSIVAKSPFESSGWNVKDIHDHFTRVTEGRVTLSIESTRQFQDLYTLSYNWTILLPLLLYITAYVMLFAEQQKEDEHRFSNRCQEEEVITKGKVQMLSKTFESKTTNNNTILTSSTKLRKTINLPITEAEIKPVQCSPLMQSKVKPSTTALVNKVRPVNITKPLNVNTDSASNSPVSVIKPFPVNQDPSNSYPQSLVKPFVVKIEKSTQTNDEIENRQNKLWISEMKNSLTNGSKPQSDDETLLTLDTVSAVKTITKSDVGVHVKPSSETFTQQTSVDITENSSQTTIILTTESSQQYDPIPTNDQFQQTSVPTTNLGTQCELLSQERYAKLQKSALSLYKKSIEKQEYVYSTLPRKINVESKITKYNKSIQVDLKLSEEDIIVNGHLHSPKKVPIPSIVTDTDLELGTTIETQTDLFGYVLDKIIQEREAGNVYSKLDLEKTVHSTISMPENVKQHTESIRFKAMKSQHGVWYVSLRGDVFLTVAKNILKNIKLNQELKIETEISSDILRAMKTFIDNYNKLSDCFEDDVESDDESFINGFRL